MKAQFTSRKMLTLSVAIGLAAATGLMVFSGPVQAGIKGSKHDMSAGGTSQTESTATTEVCVFCHTPHGSGTGIEAPLWNKSFTAPTYTRYSNVNSTTIDGSNADVGSVSLACLSCHDGSQAMDVVINAPGSGTNTTGFSDGTKKMTGFAKLGADLSNDHPISIQYGGGGWTSTNDPTLANLADKSFKPGVKATVNSKPVWWIDTDGGTAARDKSDMILYTREVGGAVQPYVECASCHDPHNAATAAANQVAFLRISNADSAVCLACHDK